MDLKVVLTTFNTLMGDLSHTKNARGSSNLRKRKKYRVVPTPLTSIEWWRICLDEAQQIEAPTAQSAKMAMNLTASLKWCITGMVSKR